MAVCVVVVIGLSVVEVTGVPVDDAAVESTATVVVGVSVVEVEASLVVEFDNKCRRLRLSLPVVVFNAAVVVPEAIVFVSEVLDVVVASTVAVVVCDAMVVVVPGKDVVVGDNVVLVVAGNIEVVITLVVVTDCAGAINSPETLQMSLCSLVTST